MADWPYNTKTWKNLRVRKLSINPLCEHCTTRGEIVPAKAVDHITAIKAGGHPFPSLEELMSLCERCHNEKTNAVDRPDRRGSGRVIKGYDADGNPLDTADGWHSA